MESAPLQVLFDTLLEESKIQISLVETFQYETRDSIALFLHQFGILNKESRRIASEDATFAAVLYYERVRMDILNVPTKPIAHESTKICFFWEGAPKQLPLAMPSSLNLIHQSKARDMTFLSISNEFRRYIQKIESGSVNIEEDEREIGNVPKKVSQFMSVVSSIFNSIRAAQAGSQFTQCWNKQCCRLFYRNSLYTIRQWFDPERACVEILDVPACVPDSCVDVDSLMYWRSCKQIPWYEDTSKRFCTQSCCIQWKRKLDSLLPKCIEFEPDLVLPVGKLSRINLAFEAALERNERFKSEMSTNLNRIRKGPVSKRLVKNEIESRIELLNVDVAMLYWSTIVSRLPKYSNDKSLPGFQSNWRSLEVNRMRCFYMSSIYSQVQEERNENAPAVVTDVFSGARFFSAIKSRCMSIDTSCTALF